MMKKPIARISGLGIAVPDGIVTNHDFEKVLETSDQWIVERTGIKQRHWSGPEMTLAELSRQASVIAMQQAGIGPMDLGAIILATATQDRLLPSTACDLQALLGAKNAAAYDLSAACSGWLFGLTQAEGLIASGQAEHVLVIGVERLSDLTDMADRGTAFIFADGAGAVVVGPSDNPGIGPVAWGSAGDMVDMIYNRDNRYIYQEGQTVFRWATTQIAPIALRALELAGLQPSDVDALIPHQANLRIVEAIAKRLRKEGAREKMEVADDIIYTGNTSSASIPIALDNMRKAGRVNTGDVLLLVGFGAGLSYAGQVVISP
jgi:3-oxoacyl-[acyl-carrier-protein] synthase-3